MLPLLPAAPGHFGKGATGAKGGKGREDHDHSGQDQRSLISDQQMPTISHAATDSCPKVPTSAHETKGQAVREKSNDIISPYMPHKLLKLFRQKLQIHQKNGR